MSNENQLMDIDLIKIYLEGDNELAYKLIQEVSETLELPHPFPVANFGIVSRDVIRYFGITNLSSVAHSLMRASFPRTNLNLEIIGVLDERIKTQLTPEGKAFLRNFAYDKAVRWVITPIGFITLVLTFLPDTVDRYPDLKAFRNYLNSLFNDSTLKLLGISEQNVYGRIKLKSLMSEVLKAKAENGSLGPSIVVVSKTKDANRPGRVTEVLESKPVSTDGFLAALNQRVLNYQNRLEDLENKEAQLEAELADTRNHIQGLKQILEAADRILSDETNIQLQEETLCTVESH